MPADGRYSSLGKCKGTIRIGSSMGKTLFFDRLVTFLSVGLFATRFTCHLHPSSLSRIGVHCEKEYPRYAP
jgi:hypothetical protein